MIEYQKHLFYPVSEMSNPAQPGTLTNRLLDSYKQNQIGGKINSAKAWVQHNAKGGMDLTSGVNAKLRQINTMQNRHQAVTNAANRHFAAQHPVQGIGNKISNFLANR